MIKISNRISIEGFDTTKDFQNWLEKQEENMPNKIILKNFKWFLMQLEDDVKNNKYNQQHVNAVDKYAIKIIEKKIMNEDNVINFIKGAQEL